MSGTPLTPLERILGWIFIALPHHFISRIIFYLTRIKGPGVTTAIRWFIKAFKVDMNDSIIQDISQFPSFNRFFVRELKPESRPIAEGSNELCSPVDGTVSQCGNIEHDLIFQAKGHYYSLSNLLGGDSELADQFINGRFATIYLAPYNYHRIHMPMDAKLEKMIYVPGRLFSVAQWTVRAIPSLFARNERVVCSFTTENGPLVMILVGAINVAAIETVWSGLITPPNGKAINRTLYEDAQQQEFNKGEEMGRFNMGSTVILLTGNQVEWDDSFDANRIVKMGEKIGIAKN